MGDFYSVLMGDFYSVGARVVGMSGVGLYGRPCSPVWLMTGGLCRPSRVRGVGGDLLPD